MKILMNLLIGIDLYQVIGIYLKKLCTWTKFFYKFITHIKSCITTSFDQVREEVLSATELFILKYKSFTTYYIFLALNSNQKSEVVNIKYSYILPDINNIFNKLMKY